MKFSWFDRPRLAVLVVCSANVCRSPAAEALLGASLRRRGLGRKVLVMSAGTDASLTAVPPDPRMVAIAREVGIRLQAFRSKPLTEVLLQDVDVLYGMEPGHVERALALRGEGVRPDVMLFDPRGEPVPDPYFGDKAGVRRSFELLATIAERRAADLERRINELQTP